MLLSLLTLGSIAAVVVDAVEVTAPTVPFGTSFDPCHPNPLLSPAGTDDAMCKSAGDEEQPAQNSTRTILVRIDETESGSFQATATITTVKTDPLVPMIQRGGGQDANAFYSAFVGFIIADGSPFDWSAPTVTEASSGMKAVITTTGLPTVQPPPPAAGPLDLTVVVQNTGTVELTTKNRIIAGVTRDGTAAASVSAEGSRTLTAVTSGGSLQISLQPAAPQALPDQSAPAGEHWMARTASTAWSLLTGFLGPLVAAGAWIALFLAGRLGGFGALGRGEIWQRTQRILGAVVLAHIVITACLQIANTEVSLEGDLSGSGSLQQSLGQAMTGAALWSPVSYPPFVGGLILLIAFAIVAARWDPQGRKRSPARQGSVLTLAILTGFVTVICYSISAYVDLNPLNSVTTSPDGVTQEVANRPLLAVELPIAAMALLSVILLASAWIAGTGRAERTVTRFRTARISFGTTAIVLAAGLIAAGTAAAAAYHSSPHSMDPTTLWTLGSLATWTVLGIVSTLVVVPILAPRAADAGERPPISLGQSRAAALFVITVAFLALAVPFLVIPRFARSDPYDGSDPQVSGTALLIFCLILAAALVAAAAGLSRPWRATSPAGGLDWAVPVIMALAVAAPFAADDGYIPAVLRWGVLIIVGTFAGVALARLLAAAVRPLGSDGKLPHLAAVIIAAAAIGIPWFELGGGGQIGWWDVESYASRIDGVLPVVLVIAGVIALRRFGLVSRRDEQTLGAHRRLGIAAWTIALSDSYSFGGSTDPAGTVALLAAAVGAWLLLPRSQVRRAGAILGQSDDKTAAAVRRAIEAGVARRTLPGLAKTMRDDVAAGKIPLARAQKKVADLENRISAQSKQDRGQTAADRQLRLADEERAFGASISPRPWVRAQWGLAFGALAGSPWVLLGLAGVHLSLAPPEGYPEFAFIAAVAPLLLRWVGYGLLFGYFFPLLRGSTGLGKSISFFALALAPSLVGTLAGPHTAEAQWHSAAILAVQLLIFALSMGLLADLAVLRSHGFTAGRLTDLHSLWSISAWASSVVVAVATGIATIILAGLQPFVIGVITPTQPSSPPAAVSHQ